MSAFNLCLPFFSRRNLVLFLAAGCLQIALPVDAKGQRVLRDAEWSSEAAFSNVVGVRETGSGLLVADRAEGAVYLVDRASGRTTRIGREGPGPTEYRGVVGLYPMGPDTTVLIDSYGAWRLIADGRVAGAHGAPSDVRATLSGPPVGAAADGTVFGVSRGADSDSLTLMGVPRAAPPFKVTRLDRPDGPIRVTGSGSMPPGILSAHPLSWHDEALAFADGWIAVARSRPYRVEWRRPGGGWVRGGPIPYQADRVTREDQCFAFRRTFGTLPCAPGVLPSWPDELPPFLSARAQVPTLFATPAGMLVVTRTPRETGITYEIVNRDGLVVDRFRLESGSFVIGFGRQSIYTVSEDPMGLQTLRRHPWGDRDSSGGG